MTNKHFIALADAIKASNEQTAQYGDHIKLPAQFDMGQLLVLADFCAQQSPNFDRERWLGYIAGTNGPSGGKR